MSNKIKIVPLTESHVEPVKCLLEGTKSFRAPEIETAMEVIDIYITKGDTPQIYVSIRDSDALGYVCFGETPLTVSTFNLYWIVVSQKYQRIGIGEMLFSFACTSIKEQGGNLIVIETSSMPIYEKSRQFYLAQTCVLEASIRNFYKKDDHLTNIY